jgi:NTE family protein
LKELRAIDFVRRLLDQGKLDPQAYRLARIHVIENQEALKPLGASSKLNAEWAFLEHLRDLGRETTQTWLDTHCDDLGVCDTTNLKTMVDGIGPDRND